MCVCVCVCERERERERDNDVDDVACVIAAANADDAIDAAIADVVHAAIYALVDANDALDVDPVVVAASGAAPPKAHERRIRPRIPCHFGRISPWRHCPFRSSSSILLNPAAI